MVWKRVSFSGTVFRFHVYCIYEFYRLPHPISKNRSRPLQNKNHNTQLQPVPGSHTCCGQNNNKKRDPLVNSSHHLTYLPFQKLLCPLLYAAILLVVLSGMHCLHEDVRHDANAEKTPWLQRRIEGKVRSGQVIREGNPNAVLRATEYIQIPSTSVHMFHLEA